jgi:hypothetical protein
MTLVASSPGSAEPLALIVRSALRSYFLIVLPSSRIRESITGTTTSVRAGAGGVAQRQLGVELAPQDDRRAEPSAR